MGVLNILTKTFFYSAIQRDKRSVERLGEDCDAFEISNRMPRLEGSLAKNCNKEVLEYYDSGSEMCRHIAISDITKHIDSYSDNLQRFTRTCIDFFSNQKISSQSPENIPSTSNEAPNLLTNTSLNKANYYFMRVGFFVSFSSLILVVSGILLYVLYKKGHIPHPSKCCERFCGNSSQADDKEDQDQYYPMEDIISEIEKPNEPYIPIPERDSSQQAVVVEAVVHGEPVESDNTVAIHMLS